MSAVDQEKKPKEEKEKLIENAVTQERIKTEIKFRIASIIKEIDETNVKLTELTKKYEIKKIV